VEAGESAQDVLVERLCTVEWLARHAPTEELAVRLLTATCSEDFDDALKSVQEVLPRAPRLQPARPFDDLILCVCGVPLVVRCDVAWRGCVAHRVVPYAIQAAPSAQRRMLTI
jgi:hypothetical protein